MVFFVFGVNSLLLGPHGVNAVGELLSLLVVGQLALHPDEIRERRVRHGTVDGTLGTALVAVVALTGTRSIPVPVNVNTGDTLGNGAGFAVALALGRLEVLLDQAVLVGVDTGIDGVNHGVAEELETSLGGPLVLNGLKLRAGLTGLLSGDHQVVQGLEVGVGGADNEGMVAVVDGGSDQGGGLGVGTGNGQEISAHDISLGTDGNQTVDVFADGNQHLTGHVATLLGTGSLVLNVNTSSTALNEELGQLHDGSQATMTGIGIGNDGTEIVDVGDVGALVLRGGDTLLALFPVVEKLCHKELVDLAGNGVLCLNKYMIILIALIAQPTIG